MYTIELSEQVTDLVKLSEDRKLINAVQSLTSKEYSSRSEASDKGKDFISSFRWELGHIVFRWIRYPETRKMSEILFAWAVYDLITDGDNLFTIRYT